jgi:hypothetical protein
LATGKDASVIIYHEDVDTGDEICDPTELDGLSWNSETTGNYITVKSYAEDIKGYKYDSVSKSKIYLQASKTYTATIYYTRTSGKDAKVYVYHEDVDTGETVASTTKLTGLSWNSENDNNYITVKDYAEDIDDYEYDSCEDSKVYLNESTTYYTTIYYKRISGKDAKVVIYHKDVDTGDTVATSTTLTGLTWNSETTGNYVTVSSHKKTITNYQYDSCEDTRVYLQASTTYYTTIYYKRISGNDAKVVIYHKELGTGTTLATSTTLTGLTWNSTTSGNYVTVKNYAVDIDGYKYDSVSTSTIYLQASTTYYATIYYTVSTATLTLVHKSTDGDTFETETITATVGGTITPANSAYVNSYTNYVFSYAEDPSGTDYPKGSTSTYKVTGNATITYYYEYVESATFYASEVGYTNIVLTVRLSQSFTSSNYQQIIFTAKAGDYSGAFMKWTVSDASTTSNVQEIDTANKNVSLTPGKSYTIYCYAQAKNGTYYLVNASNGDDHIVVTLLKIDDEDLVANCTARWYNYAAGNRGSWPTDTINIVITMGDYAYNSKYFMEAGLVQTSTYNFTQPSTTAPRSDLIKDTDTPTATGVNSVTLSQNGLGRGVTDDFTVYLKTINGTYMPIPAVIPKSSTNEYEMIGATKPNSVSYTTGHVPTRGSEINLLASDILNFIAVTDLTVMWMFDELAGVDKSKVAKGSSIYASTFADLYSFLERIKSHKSFTNSFASVSPGNPIEAANLNNLVTSLNAMLGVV